MSFENPRIKVTGVVFQNKYGSKYYSNYFLAPKEHRGDFDLATPDSQRKFEHGLRAKAQRLSASDQSTPRLTQPRSSPSTPTRSSSRWSTNFRSSWLPPTTRTSC